MDSKNSMNITDNILASCRMYNFVMRGIIGGSVSVVGIVCNIGSLNCVPSWCNKDTDHLSVAVACACGYHILGAVLLL